MSAAFDKPLGPVHLDPHGRWWIKRAMVNVEGIDGTVGLAVSDGDHVAQLRGTPAQLYGVAQAIIAQVDAAVANSTPQDLARSAVR